MLLRRANQYRIYPTMEQQITLGEWENALRFLWNLALDQTRMVMHRCKADRHGRPSAISQMYELPELRAMLPWLDAVPRDACNQVLIRLDQAWQRCFKGIGREPSFKRKGRDRVAVASPDPRAFRIKRGSLVFPKLGTVRAVVHRPLPDGSKTRACTIQRDGNQWFAAIQYEIEIADPVPSTKPPIALDRGVVNLLADSSGRIVKNPRSAEKLQSRVARTQRVVARRKRGSRNQKKARLRVATLQRKARRQCEAILHRESLRYAKSHGTLIFERLEIRNMTRSARGTVDDPGTNVAAKAGLNRGILGASWGRFEGMCRYKVVPEGGNVLEVRAAYSSQTCAECGVVDPASRRSQSEFVCVACGHQDHADVNAAKVLLSRGTHGDAGCGGYVIGRPAKQQLRVVRRGTRTVNTGVLHGSLREAPAFTPG